MYVHVWNKYLPIIKILLKRSATAGQTLDLNRVDFERAGSGRKAGYKFTIELSKGRVSNVISGSALATDLASVLLNDPVSRAILVAGDFAVSLSPKFQLSIINRNPVERVTESSRPEESSENENGGEDGPAPEGQEPA